MDVPEIEAPALADLHARGVTLIDVRNPDEYEAGHVPGARLIPLPEVSDRADEVPAGEPVYVICAVGVRSRRACELLAGRGRDVTNVAGGTKGWIEAGLPVTRGLRAVSERAGASERGRPARCAAAGGQDMSERAERVSELALHARRRPVHGDLGGASNADQPTGGGGELRAVADDAALRDVVAALASQPAYALDTEFHREKTYYPRVALVQMAWAGDLVLIDPVGLDLTPFAAVLDSDAIAVLHAADQDLEVLDLACRTHPAAAVRHPDRRRASSGMASPSLSSVYERELGLRLPKADRLTDWLAPAAHRRPARSTPPPTSPTCSTCTSASPSSSRPGAGCSGRSTSASSCAGASAAAAIPTRRGGGSRRPAACGARPGRWPRRWPGGASGGRPSWTCRCAT